MNQQPAPEDDRKASRVAMIGIIAGLIFTAAGMLAHSPVLGVLALLSLTVVIMFRRQIARLLPFL